MRSEDGIRNARLDLLEVMSAGVIGSAIAPTPGILLEMLEIAASDHHAVRQLRPMAQQISADVQPLTNTPNSSGMIAFLPRLGRAVAHVAANLRALRSARRVPA